MFCILELYPGGAESILSKNPQLIQPRSLTRLLVLTTVIGLIAGFYWSGLADSITFERIQRELHYWQDYTSANLILASVGFVLIYATVTGLSLPIASWLSLLAGALFGRWLGTGLVSVGATLGATLAMLASRYLLRDWLLARLAGRLAPLQHRFERDGPYCLLTLRLIPVFPFWMVNLGLGLTTIRTRVYMALSWIGMLPGTFVYVSLGTDLANIESPRGLITLTVLRWFILLGLLPWLLRFGLGLMKSDSAETPPSAASV